MPFAEQYFQSCKEDNVEIVKTLLFYNKFSPIDLRAGYNIAC